jgi:hypothetical protein
MAKRYDVKIVHMHDFYVGYAPAFLVRERDAARFSVGG